MDNKIKIVSFIPLALYADTDEEGSRYASLTWSIRMGYPRLSVYTDNTRDKRDDFSYDKLIIAPLDAVTVNIVIDMLNKVISNPKEHHLSIKCLNVKYVNNVKTDEVAVQATIVIGRTEQGVIYLSAIADSKKKVRFNLVPNKKWHRLLDADGNDVTDNRVLSNTYAKAYSARLKALMDKFLVDDSAIKYTEKKNSVTRADPGNMGGLF